MKKLLLLMTMLTVVPALDAAADQWILTSDYSLFGRARSYAPEFPWAVSADLAVTPGDPTGRFHEGKVYVVGRGGSNLVQVYTTGPQLTLEREFGIGAGRNPQDIAFDAAGEAYVSCYDQAVLLRVDVTTGMVLDTYDTAPFADADGLPETAWMIAVGDLLYVTCQKLDRNNGYGPTGPGALLVFDMAAEAWADQDPQVAGVQPITLTGANPYTRLEILADGSGGWNLRVGCAGFFALNDGGIEDIDPVGGVSLGYLVTEEELGGDVTGFASTDDAVHVLSSALVGGSTFITSLRRWRPADDSLAVLDTGTGYVHADLVWDGGFQLFVADRTLGAAGLRVFDTNSGAELTAGPLATGLPPFQFVMPGSGGVSPVPTLTLGGLSLSHPRPNPCNPLAELVVSGRPGATVKIGVYDLAGRRVRDRMLELNRSGEAVFRFDGRDGQGRSLAAGVYRIVGQDGSGFAGRTVTLVK